MNKMKSSASKQHDKKLHLRLKHVASTYFSPNLSTKHATSKRKSITREM
jgi:hypothetical protein